MEECIVLKIGGSVVTHKDVSTHTVREDVLRSVFAQIALVKKQKPQMQIILIHGAGGHIHHLAYMYNLRSGTGTDQNKIEGAQKTHEAVLRLHAEIMDIATTCAFPLYSVPTDTVITQTDKKISHCTVAPIKTALQKGLIPVLYGDMVIDTTLGMSICSGDTLASCFAKEFPITKLLFSTDVDGIYTDDPHITEAAELVENVSLTRMEEIVLRGSHNTDTTDGLRGKVAACEELFQHSITLSEIHIFNGFEKENYRKVLLGEDFTHTCIKK